MKTSFQVLYEHRQKQVFFKLQSYQEAAEHFLTALNFQAAGRGPQGTESKAVMSESIWSSLRFCLSLMDRKDLHSAVDERNLAKLNNVLSTTGF